MPPRSAVRVVAGLAVVLGASCAPQRQPAERGFVVRLVTSAAESGHWEVAAERGLGRIAAELGADVARVRVGDDGSGAARLAELASSGVDLLVCVGAGLEAPVFATAPAHPETAFVVLPGTSFRANAAAIDFSPEGAGYLAGVVAAEVATEGRVGLLRGDGGPWLIDLEDGFVAGVSSRGRGAEVVPAVSPDALQLIAREGVEVALYAADHMRTEVLDAAHAVGIKLVVTDPELLARRPEVALAAVEVDVAEAMLRVAREVADGSFAGRVYSFDVGSGVLDVRLGGTLDSDAAARAREALESARAEVTAGIVEIEEMGL